MDGSFTNRCLSEILDPCTREEFLASSWGKTYRHIRGARGKFSHLLPWSELNEILRRHRLDFPRLRLVRDGKGVPLTSYLRHVTAARRKAAIPRLVADGLTRQLREGATLVLDAVDELYRPLEQLAEQLERFFREHVQINAYAGWHTSRGFDVHFDEHDVFILQVTGRKRWSVYGMTKPHTLARDDAGRPEKPADDRPLWQETLEAGDLLYIPRGWWHVAEPLDEPTLHLTVGIHNRTGVDLLRWLGERMSASETFMRDLPRFASAEERAAHMNQLREQLLGAWDDQLLERYLEDYDAMAAPRARVNLPWSVTREILPPEPDTLLRLTAPRPLDFKIEGGAIEFACNRKRWRFAEDAADVLRALDEGRARTISELCEAARGKLDGRTVRTFLGELILHGLVAVADD
ncbi:MAG TPA: cupin domain-containing protein [Pyrinomonadaceae bacterium]|nr:cupin domain-containing protein [Pyrinomonadaceae bacterium]